MKLGTREAINLQKIEVILGEDASHNNKNTIVITPAFIDPHSHIGMVRLAEPSKEDEANEQMNSILNALHSITLAFF